MRTTIRPWAGLLAGSAALMVLCGPPAAQARDLAIAMASAVTAIDPHYHNLSSNFNVAMNIFDRMIDQDAPT